MFTIYSFPVLKAETSRVIVSFTFIEVSVNRLRLLPVSEDMLHISTK